VLTASARQVAPATVSLTSNQAIAFDALPAHGFGDAAFALSANSTSGLRVAFAAAGGCSVVGSSVTITGAGSCTVTATQAGNQTYNAAPPVARTFAIARAAATLAVGSREVTYDGTPQAGDGELCTAGPGRDRRDLRRQATILRCMPAATR